jgi:hypothetical protein
MSRKTTRTSVRHNSPAAPESADSAAATRQLTINVPSETLHRAKTLAGLQGTTLSAIVAEALAAYATKLPEALVKLGLTK